MNELEAALNLLDECVAVIQELLAQNQSKGQQSQDMSKKAELLAAKSGMSFQRASGIIKEASDKGVDADVLIKTAEETRNSMSFGKVASYDNQLTKTGSTAIDKFLDLEADLKAEFGLR